MNEIIYPELSYKICGSLFYVHNKLGRFRKEKEYADALEIVFKESKIPYEREFRIDNEILDQKFSLYRFDFIVDDKLIIELKSRAIVSKDDYYQFKRYLQAKKLKLGLLVNFRDKYLKPKRILNSYS